MKSDLMLTWMSEQTQGTVPTLVQKLLWLFGLPDDATGRKTAKLWIYRLVALGHCELSADGRRWWISPAAFVKLPFLGGWCAFAGARRSTLVDECEALNLDVTEVRHAAAQPEDLVTSAPSAWYIQFDSDEDCDSVATELGFANAGLAGEEIALRLPREPRLAVASSPVAQQELQRFVVEQPVDGTLPRWKTFDSVGEAPFGLYRQQMSWRKWYWLRNEGEWFRIDGHTGMHFVLGQRGMRTMKWTASDPDYPLLGTLEIRKGYYLPKIQERALVLTSGLLPAGIGLGNRMEYKNVPRDVAKRVADSVGQRLIEKRTA